MIFQRRIYPIVCAFMIVSLLTACSGFSAREPENTPIPTTGSLKGKITDVNGKPLINPVQSDYGYLILFCPTEDMNAECLHESDKDLDVNTILGSICKISDWDEHCKFHLSVGAAEIMVDGSYSFIVVPPGTYELILIMVSGGIAISIHLLNVEPVQAGVVTRYDFSTK